jgi:hypothetical protein
VTYTPFALFHNRLRIMLNIDKFDLDAAVGEETSMYEWNQFAANPWRWFIEADTRRAGGVFQLIEAREEAWADKRRRKTPEPHFCQRTECEGLARCQRDPVCDD